jgi:hypothetical protein
MTKSFFRTLLGALGAVALLGSAAPAAAQVTIAGCASPAWNAANNTLTCGGAGAFSCTVAANPANPVPGQPTTLTATCSGGASPYSYAWSVTPAGCPAPSGTANSTSVTSAVAAGPCVYKVTATDSTSPTPQTSAPTVPVTWSSTPVAPSGCTITANGVNPLTIAAAGVVTFATTCTGGSAPTSYAWTGTGLVTPTGTNQQSITVSTSGTFSVTPSNAGGNGNTPSVTVTVGGGGGGGPNCTGQPGITGRTVFVDIGWSPYNAYHTQDYGGFNGGDALVIHIKPPVGYTSTGDGYLTVKEYGGGTGARFGTLSQTPCSFAGTFWFPSYTIPALFYGSTDVQVQNIRVNQPLQYKWNLQPGVDYYLNFKNTGPDGLTPGCTGNCNVVIEWKPSP